MILKRISALAVALTACLTLFAQGQVTTRRYRISDFQDKMTKVVLSENAILSEGLRQEIINNWTSTVFEFCTLEQFESLKTNDSYYFLIPLENKFKGEEEAGVVFLTLLKGGKEASEGISSMFEVVSLPLTAVLGVSDRDLIYMGGIVNAIQDYALAAMESESAAYKRELWFNGRFDKELRSKDFYIAEEDLSSDVKEKDLAKLLENEGLHIVNADESDAVYLGQERESVVGYSISPVMPSAGSFSYQLLFDAESHRLCHVSKHKISAKKSQGFLTGDLKPLGVRK